VTEKAKNTATTSVKIQKRHGILLELLTTGFWGVYQRVGAVNRTGFTGYQSLGQINSTQ
jgi:hypothetical protein